jgi:hypothetical protein
VDPTCSDLRREQKRRESEHQNGTGKPRRGIVNPVRRSCMENTLIEGSTPMPIRTELRKSMRFSIVEFRIENHDVYSGSDPSTRLSLSLSLSVAMAAL